MAGERTPPNFLTDPLTRRVFMRRAIQLGATVGGAGLLAACDSGSSTGAEPTTSAGTATGAVETAGQPKRGGTIRFAGAPGARGYDPHKWWDGWAWGGITAVNDPILVATQEGALEAGIAELPEIGNEGTLYTFTLRPDVMFHHGRVMTADDAKFSLDRLLRPATGNEGSSLYNVLPIVGLQPVLNEEADEVSGIKVVDDLTFTIELEQPDSALPYVMTLPFAAVIPRDVVEEMGDEAFNLAPVGNGPFTMSDVNLETGLTLERFPDYWNPEVPYVDRVEWTSGTGVDLAVLQVQSGELDMVQETPPAGTVSQLQDDPGENGQLFVGPVNLEYFMNMNTTYEPLKNVDVRRALAMAIDRERLVRALQGLPVVSEGGLFTSLTPYYQEGLAIPYDPEGAKQLLADAGYADGFDLNILGQNTSPFTEMAQTAQADLEAVGINATAEIATPELWVEKSYTGKNPEPMVAHLWDLPYPHGSYLMDGGFTSGGIEAGCCNLSVYGDPEFDELARQAHLAVEESEIIDLYKQMDKKIVQDDVVAIPLFQGVRIELLSKRLQGFFAPATLSTTHLFREYWIDEEAA
jgi:ABC-type transport system substrate-binding protein